MVNTHLHIIRQGESESVEFKSAFNADVIATLVAFTNTRGGAVYIGINNEGQATDVSLNTETLQQWVNEVKTKTSPSIIPDASIMDTQDNHITIEDLLSNDYRSTPRNKLIADFCKHIGVIEKYGSGIQRIINQCHDHGLPTPEFRQISEGFMVTVSDGVVDDQKASVVEKVVEKVVENLTDNQQQILTGIERNPYISAKVLAAEVGISSRKIQDNIKKLKDQGIIKRIGPAKGGHWEIVK